MPAGYAPLSHSRPVYACAIFPRSLPAPRAFFLLLSLPPLSTPSLPRVRDILVPPLKGVKPAYYQGSGLWVLGMS